MTERTLFPSWRQAILIARSSWARMEPGRWLDPIVSLSPWHKFLSIVVISAGAIGAMMRLTQGLGAATNLSDAYPWGLWVGFDILIGVATSAGGFTIAFAVYILGRRSYQPIARAAVLTAFLGYVFAVGGLMMDLGHPWRIWHPMFFWNPRSVLFEVSVCVMLYNTVLAVEFSPEILGFFGRKDLGNRIHRTMPFFAGLGFVLSTLHQSSLGGLYLIVPTKLHPFWYTPLLPLLFYLSAIKCGLGMVMVEASLSHFGLGAQYEDRPLRALGRWLLAFTVLHALLQGGDMVHRGALASGSTYERALLTLEIAVGALLPVLLLAARSPAPSRLFVAGLLAVTGVMLNRLNVSLTGFESSRGFAYIPSLIEISVTAALVVGGVLLFRTISLNLALFVPDPGETRPLIDRSALAMLGAVIVLLSAVLVAHGFGSPRAAAENGLARRGGPGDVVYSREMGVVFRHGRHAASCGSCHGDTWSVLPERRLSKPRGHEGSGCGTCHDGARSFSMDTACARCHSALPRERTLSDHSSPGAICFSHDAHVARALDCRVCHAAMPSGTGHESLPGHVSMEELFRGRSCGACHGRGRSFGLAACSRCHEID